FGLLVFSVYWLRLSPAVLSFPTRRSSDLIHPGVESFIAAHDHRKPVVTKFVIGDTPKIACFGGGTTKGDRRVFHATHIRSNINRDRKSTRLNSSHVKISYAVFCLKKKKNT